VRLGDDEGALAGRFAGAERDARHRRVVAGARCLEVRQVNRVVDVAERVGVDEADLDRMLVGEFALYLRAPCSHPRG
jgi:hypothetical protein